MNFYVTFGQQYRREPHPAGMPIDPDAVIRIEAEDKNAARAKAWTIFQGHFHRVLDDTEWEKAKEHFPHGIINLILVDGHDAAKAPQPEYIGDSVYLQLDSRGIGIVLTTRNGLPTDPSNTIFLDWSVYERLLDEVARMKEGG